MSFCIIPQCSTDYVRCQDHPMMMRQCDYCHRYQAGQLPPEFPMPVPMSVLVYQPHILYCIGLIERLMQT